MKQTKHYILILLALVCQLTYAQVGIGTTNPDPSSILDLDTNNSGILIPRLTTLEKSNISNPATGLMVYDLTEQSFSYFNGTTWSRIVIDSQLQIAHEGYSETGTRDNADLNVTLGDFDDSGNGTKLIIDDNSGIIKAKSGLEVNGWTNFITGAYTTQLKNNGNTADRSIIFPNESGELALKGINNLGLQGYYETGTRSGGDLIVTLGDYDSSYTDFKAVIDIDQEWFYTNYTIGGSLGVGNPETDFIGAIHQNLLTQNQSYELPNETGVIALKESTNLQAVSDIGNSTTNELELNGGINLNGSTITLSDIDGDVQFISASSGNIEIGSDYYYVDITADSGMRITNGGLEVLPPLVSRTVSFLEGKTVFKDTLTSPQYDEKVEIYDGNLLIEDGHLIMKDKVNGNHYKIEMINGVLTTTQVTL
ncbi:hypothetical protein FHS04_002820 [Mesoflavibacter sabulilitoris]|uniref:Uncharacterized protein n=1 Tax=Mesoflavibacter zeaxanthinifaciens subsp. sabulilitoris TaxID=1520893 RepID=A0A2T1NNP3_9FLAO|nr:hypothetical protein [Mesoflavibacter zeaxanthinifaciens]MBB3125276.1 hypothetical protein [Mesoflavibacter zeaxanthinifaciens subsp. sabulilitoris]PSG94512.1 hypothetical protein C7H61_00835 [Mesoflavibacter zeaxanthinifaciens subsp. sabulilitoris]